MQMEPHFLFNTLSAITTLVEFGRQAEAVEALAHLNTLLKTTLSWGTPEKIPLARELEFIGLSQFIRSRMAMASRSFHGGCPGTTTRQAGGSPRDADIVTAGDFRRSYIDALRAARQERDSTTLGLRSLLSVIEPIS